MKKAYHHIGGLFIFNFFFFASTCTGFSQTTQNSSGGSGPSAPKSKYAITWIDGQNRNVNEFSIWGGYAFNSFNLWGKTPQSTLSLMGIRYNRKILRLRSHILEYTLDVNLYAHYTYPQFTAQRQRNSISGAGFSPLGFQINFSTLNRLQPFLKTSGGFMFLSQPFPDNRGEKMNFTFEAGGGLEYVLTSHLSLSLGYRFFHLSNGETGQVNPGIDSSFFYGGLTVF